MAADYAARNAEHAYNAFYERPALIAMLVTWPAGGCWGPAAVPGVLAAWLAAHGMA
jgi:hypothetical protein